jgi:hypothetical protein
MPTLLSFLFRALLLAAALVFAASMVFVLAIVVAVWLARAAWAKLTGRLVKPFVMRANPRDGFNRMYRKAEAASRTPRADSVVTTGGRMADVTDVKPK